MYVCVCVCVFLCLCLSTFENLKRLESVFTNSWNRVCGGEGVYKKILSVFWGFTYYICRVLRQNVGKWTGQWWWQVSFFEGGDVDMNLWGFQVLEFFFFICGKMGEIDDDNGGKLSGVEFANVCLCYGSIIMVPNFFQRVL